MNRKALYIATLLLGVFFLGPIAGAQAQLSNLDKGQLIEFMRSEGMRELLKHLVESEPMDDPVINEQVYISMLLLDYKDLRAQGDVEGAIAKFREAWTRMETMIEKNPDHPNRPMWQTQLAELLQFDFLQTLNMNAAEFYEFGVVSEQQRDAFEEAVPRIHELLESADVRFFALQTELPKEEDHIEKRVNTGLWARMIKEYYQTRTRFAMARSSYLMTLIPSDHEYYKTLRENPNIVRQAKDPAAEKVRLLKLSTESLDSLLSDPNDEWSIQTRCRAILARVKAAQRQFSESQELFDTVLKQKLGDMTELVAMLGSAFALDANKRTSEAMIRLDEATAHTLARENLLIQVLTVDAKHTLMLKNAKEQPADKRAKAVANAYQPYLDLLNDPEVADNVESLRGFIYRRWVDNVKPNQDLSTVPPVVVCAMGETLRKEGQNQRIEANNAGDQAMADEADEKLQRAIKINRDLRSRDDASDQVIALAMFNEAMAVYFANQSDEQSILKAGTIFMELADKYPDQQVAAQGASYGAEMLHQLHSSQSKVPGVGEAYVTGINVLLEKFPASEATNNERFYYASSLLIPNGEYEKAAEVLGAIPSEHITHYVGQRERLYCLFELFKQNPETADNLKTAAEGVIRSAEASESRAEGEERDYIRNAKGHAELLLAQLAGIQGNIEQALSYLRDFEQEYLAENDLLRTGLGLRITLLARAGKFSDAGVEASKMMKSFPDDAAPVINDVLTALDNRATELREEAAKELVARRKEALNNEAKSIAETAANMAQLLVDWAAGQGFAEEEMVPFKLILAKSMRTSGDSKKALTILQPVYDNFNQDAGVISEYAETLYAVGGKDNLIKAGDLYKVLISGLRPDENGQYPAEYWNAWMRYFQISEKTNTHTDVIAARVRSLEASDPQLGGEPYASELRRLRNKYAR